MFNQVSVKGVEEKEWRNKRRKTICICISCVCDFKNIWKKYYFKIYVKQFNKLQLDRRKFIRGNLRMENTSGVD